MITKEEIISVCSAHTSNQILLQPMQQNLLMNARSSLRIPPSEEVICLINLTFFGSFKDAIAFCTRGIYHKNINDKLDYMSWDLFTDLDFQYLEGFGSRKLNFTNGRIWDINTGGDSKVINVVFRQLHSLCRQIATKPKSVMWHVAISSQQYGPYDDSNMKAMLKNGQIDSSIAMVWREGFSSWLLCSDVPELQLPSAVKLKQSPPAPKIENPLQTGSHQEIRVESQITENQHNVSDDKTKPKIDINNASLDDLLYLPGLTFKTAKSLIEERQNRFGFNSVEEIGEYLNFPPHMVQRMRERIRIEPLAGKGNSISAKRRVIDF